MNELVSRIVLHGLVLLVLSSTSVLADSDGAGARSNKLTPVQELIEQGDYNTALEALKVLHQEDQDDPDVLNLLGYSYRKLGDVDNALDNYQAALKLDPKHRGANEYLGELYLETGQLSRAEERLAVLDRACLFGCEQYTDLKEAIETYKKENGVN